MLLAPLALLAAAASCAPLDGAGDLLAPGRVIVLGEIHGTAEAPAAVAQLACHAKRRGLDPFVALEIPRGETPHLERFLAGEGTLEQVVGGRFWQKDYQDGRSSAAMAGLIETLAGMELDVGFYDVDVQDAQRDRKMAGPLIEWQRKLSERVLIVLTGNLHARRGQNRMARYLEAALPDGALVSLLLQHAGGSAWVCTPDSGCGAVQLRGREGEPGIDWDPASPGSYHGVWRIGPITASPPAKRSK